MECDSAAALDVSGIRSDELTPKRVRLSLVRLPIKHHYQQQLIMIT